MKDRKVIKKKKKFLTPFQGRILLSLCIIIPVGFGTKFYQGPFEWWMNDYVGGSIYEIFWCFVVVILWPAMNEWIVGTWVFLITSFLEFFQLWHPPFLEVIRSTFLGRTLIGQSFTWMDFPYYIIGCVLGGLWIRELRKIKDE